MTETLVASPDPEFNIHEQPTWIALSIGAIKRGWPDLEFYALLGRTEQTAVLAAQTPTERFRLQLDKDDMGTDRVVWIDPMGSAY